MKAGILVVSNDRTVFDYIKPQLVLLRSNDTIYECDYNEALDVVEKTVPQLVILHCGYDLHSFSKLVKQLSVPVIALFDSLDSDYLLTAYENGITDFITKNSTQEEMLTRVMLALKNKSLKENYQNSIEVLKKHSIVNAEGFYINPAKIFPYYLKITTYGTLLLIASKQNIEYKISRALRATDVKAMGIGNNYYIFMPYTDIDGAVSVLKKITHGVADVHAGICSHYGKKDFNALNSILENALNVAVGTLKEYIIIDENLAPSTNWIEKISSGKKNFKLFKQEFNKMLEQVLIPVFYQMQTKYDNTLFNSKIIQAITPDSSVFKIRGEYFDSEFRLKSSGFSAITIDIVHNTKEKKITLDLNDMEPKTLEVLLEEFIEEHKMYMEEIC